MGAVWLSGGLAVCAEQLHLDNGDTLIVGLEYDDLIEKALQNSGLKTKKEVVHEALRQYVASLKKKQLLSIREKDTWEGDLRQMRQV